MGRSIIILLIIAVISLVLFKMFDQNINAEDAFAENTGAISNILANQHLILEKLDIIDGKIDILKTRIR